MNLRDRHLAADERQRAGVERRRLARHREHGERPVRAVGRQRHRRFIAAAGRAEDEPRQPAEDRHRLQRVADLVLDPASREVLRGEDRLSLTRTEYNLLERLMYRAGKVVSRRSLIESVWGFDREIEENTLDAFMHLLRNKIDPPGRPKLIHTVRGVGYMIRPDGQA